MAGPVLTFLSNTEIAAACARAIIVRSMTAGSDVPVASVVSVVTRLTRSLVFFEKFACILGMHEFVQVFAFPAISTGRVSPNRL